MEALLEITPRNELHFRGPFNDVTTTTLQMENLSDTKPVCFKVKTTAPKKYCVRPTAGVVLPGQKLTVQILLQPFDFDPNDPQKHKFLVQSMCLHEETNLNSINHETIWKTASSEEIMETKLRCVLSVDDTINEVTAPQRHHRSADTKSNAAAVVFQTGDTSNVMVELNELRSLNAALKRENAKLRETGLRQRLVVDSGSGGGAGVAQTIIVEEPPINVLGDASSTSLLVLAFILIACGFLIAKTIF